MIFENVLLFMGLLIGLIFMIAGVIQLVYPPMKVNPFYGYRTRNSMRNLEIWKFAQTFSAKLMIILGGGYAVLLSLLSLFIEDNDLGLYIALAGLVGICLGLFFIVERNLQKRM